MTFFNQSRMDRLGSVIELRFGAISQFFSSHTWKDICPLNHQAVKSIDHFTMVMFKYKYSFT